MKSKLSTQKKFRCFRCVLVFRFFFKEGYLILFEKMLPQSQNSKCEPLQVSKPFWSLSNFLDFLTFAIFFEFFSRFHRNQKLKDGVTFCVDWCLSYMCTARDTLFTWAIGQMSHEVSHEWEGWKLLRAMYRTWRNVLMRNRDDSQDSLWTRQKHSVGKRDVVCGHVVRRVKDQVESSRDKCGRVGRVVIRM